jgi:hypothetical protein
MLVMRINARGLDRVVSTLGSGKKAVSNRSKRLTATVATCVATTIAACIAGCSATVCIATTIAISKC